MPKPVLFRITNNLGVGGVQRRLRAILPLLMEHYDVHVVTYKDRGVFFDELSTLGVHAHFLPRKGHWNPQGIRELAALFRRYKADIVHTHSFGANIYGILAAALARVPVRLGQVHSRGQHWYGKTALRRGKQICEEALVHRLFTHHVACVSEETLDYFATQTRLPRRMLSVLHNGLEPPRSVPPFSKKELGLPENVPLLGFVGRLTKGKGLDFFLRFAAQAAKGHPNAYHFVIIGGGNQTPYRTIQKELRIDSTVTFTGEQTDMARVYPLLDGLLFTSDAAHEGMPGVVLEACAHGLPILAREARPITEIRQFYDRIRLFDDTPASAQLDALLAMAPVDKTRFWTEFSLQAMQNRTHELYQRLSQARNREQA